jgi:hypothetical protein
LRQFHFACLAWFAVSLSPASFQFNARRGCHRDVPRQIPAIVCEQGIFVSFDYSSDALSEIESFFKRSHKVIVVLSASYNSGVGSQVALAFAGSKF